MSNEYNDWKNDELADLNYCIRILYDGLMKVFNKIYDDVCLKSINNVLTKVNEISMNDKKDIVLLNELLTQEYDSLKGCLHLLEKPLQEDMNKIIDDVEQLRGHNLGREEESNK